MFLTDQLLIGKESMNGSFGQILKTFYIVSNLASIQIFCNASQRSVCSDKGLFTLDYMITSDPKFKKKAATFIKSKLMSHLTVLKIQQ